jgi:O-antigen ligase
LKQSLWEVRPWAYLVFLYILSSQLLPAGRPLKVIAWPFVIGSGLKGIQGSVEFLLNRNVIPRPDTILAHEEALFFSCYAILTTAMWVFGLRGRLRTVATVLLPFVILADLANGRRTAWVILPACLTVVAVMAWVRHPARRKPIAVALASVAIAGGLYLPLFWNGSGTLSQPARALRSAIYPNTRDANSDAYRLIEDTNLWAEIKYSPIWGTGFGIPIQEVVPNVDLSNIDPSIKYIQHNQILYLWWRTGTLGAIAFWWVVGAAMIAACALARTRDTQTLVLGTFVAAVLVAYAIEGWYDMGLTSFRIELFMGCLLGALEAARRQVKPALPQVPTRALTARHAPRTRIAVGAGRK